LPAGTGRKPPIERIIVLDRVRIGIDFRFVCFYLRTRYYRGIAEHLQPEISEGLVTMTIWAELDDWIENVGTHEDGNVDLGLVASQTPRPLLAVGTNVMSEPGSENEDGTSSTSPDKLDALDVLCSRYRHVLLFSRLPRAR